VVQEGGLFRRVGGRGVVGRGGGGIGGRHENGD
jgi:hypothetical protein